MIKIVEIKLDFLSPCLYVYENGNLVGEYCDLYEDIAISEVTNKLESLYNHCCYMDERFKMTIVDKKELVKFKPVFLSLLEKLNSLLQKNCKGRYLIKDLETSKFKALK